MDEDLSQPWEFGLRVWSTLPNLIEEVSQELGGSNLEAMRLANKMRRNVGRSIWANVLQGWKLVRAMGYHAELGRVADLSSPRQGFETVSFK